MSPRFRYTLTAAIASACALATGIGDANAACQESLASQDNVVCSPPGPFPDPIDVGPQNDTLKLVNLTNAFLPITTGIIGGPGIDALTLDNTQIGGAARIVECGSSFI